MRRNFDIKFVCSLAFFLLSLGQLGFSQPGPVRSETLRPPAVPLVVHDPYFSIWSMADTLAHSPTRHWTTREHPLCSLVRIDGVVHRIMGAEPARSQTMRQIRRSVLPTRTIYGFEAAGVRVSLTFTSPVLPSDLEVLSRPVTYLTWQVQSIDGSEHEVQIYFDAAADLVVNNIDQSVVWDRPEVEGLTVLRIGSESQEMLKPARDDSRIEWGYLYVGVPKALRVSTAIASGASTRRAFASQDKEQRLPDRDDPKPSRAVEDDAPVLAVSFDFGTVGSRPASRHLLLGYDDLYSIDYFGENLRPYWRRNGLDAAGLLKIAAEEYEKLRIRCAEFDRELMKDLTEVGGAEYASLCSLAYRHALGAHKLTAGAGDGRPLLFSKECFSNGCMATVDVMYPASPLFMLLSNPLLKAAMLPVLEYAAMDRWPWPFAPHDIGRYPVAMGQVYGGGEKTEDRQMPVEECGNMLIQAAVACKIDGNARFAEAWWPQLDQWANYLREKGFDPENQLCTDDFAGHLAHNANLSIKAIEALGAYSMMCRMAGRDQVAEEFLSLAKKFAEQWQVRAADGDHYRLAFDSPGTWSQKYNLVWDRLLGLNLFSDEVLDQEITYYKTKLNPYGLPLDNRADYAKLDWEVWTATLAASRTDFDALMAPVYRFVNRTQDRVPLTDWYWTKDARWRGFQARPVVGGVFIKALSQPEIWKKWSSQGKTK